MVVLRYVYLLALVVWLGGMVMLGAVVAPTTFQVLQERQGDAGRVLAGAVFGETLRRFHLVAYVAGGIVLASLVWMALARWRQPGLPACLLIAATMLALTLVSGTVISPRIERVRAAVGGSVVDLPAADPRRMEFGRLHGVSTGLMLVNIVGGLVLLYWEARR